MAEVPVSRIALLSVHPEYAAALIGGTKMVEFRKRRLAPDVTHVAIYATQPIGRVVAIFSIDEQVSDTPRRLWQRFRHVAGISRAKFLEYFAGYSSGVGIQVGRLAGIDHVTLEDAFGISRPPQGVQYFSKALPSLTSALPVAFVQSMAHR